VVVAEGIPVPKGKTAATHISEQIRELANLETRETILGYIQRGGTPSPMDRILATRYGAYAVELIAKDQFGLMVCSQGNNITSVPLKEVAGKLRTIPKDHPLIEKAIRMGICFGNREF
jgi:6-phosphofructokinase 1